nr:hypothetical protein [uncultured Dysosmobacter sp.]
MAAIHGAGAAAAKLEIMDSFAFDDISAFLTSDCVLDNSWHTFGILVLLKECSFQIWNQLSRKKD